jgi:hypothetical protein
MKPEGSLQPATGPYPDQMNPVRILNRFSKN